MALSARDRAYEWLHTAILAGDIPSGAFIDEASVCEATGVSRTPVREAFHRLAGERFIQLVPRRGAQVRELRPRDIVDAYGARWVIESAAIKAVLKSGADVFERMSSILESMEHTTSLSTSSARVDYVALDRVFHRCYVEALDNAVLLEFYDTLWPLHEWSVLRGRATSPEFITTVNCEHRRIFEALSQRDEQMALSVLFDHLRPFNLTP